MVALVARYLVREGMADEVARQLRDFAPLARAEPGCSQYVVHQDAAEPRRILLYEQYLDERALEAHRETEHFKSVIEGRVLPLLERREREVYTVIG